MDMVNDMFAYLTQGDEWTLKGMCQVWHSSELMEDGQDFLVKLFSLTIMYR